MWRLYGPVLAMAVAFSMSVSCVSCGIETGTGSVRNQPEGKLAPPGVEKVGQDRVRNAFDEPPRVTRVYRTALTRREILDFYSDELESRGWFVVSQESDFGMVWSNGTFRLSVGFGSQRPSSDEIADQLVVRLEDENE